TYTSWIVTRNDCLCHGNTLKESQINLKEIAQFGLQHNRLFGFITKLFTLENASKIVANICIHVFMFIETSSKNKGTYYENNYMLTFAHFIFVFAQKDAEDEGTQIAFENLCSEKKLDEVTESFNKKLVVSMKNERESHIASEEARRAEEATEREMRICMFNFVCFIFHYREIVKDPILSFIKNTTAEILFAGVDNIIVQFMGNYRDSGPVRLLR
ncbi:hypothetical protein ACJX0J_034093, partial [Zea mays]